MLVDCIPHAAIAHTPAAHPMAFHRRSRVIGSAVGTVSKPPVVKVASPHRVRPRECAPGAAAIPLAELSSANIQALYIPPAPYAGGPGYGSDASGTAPSLGGGPASASGTDLPTPSLAGIGPASEGGAPSLLGVPSNLPGGPTGRGGGSGGAGGGGTGTGSAGGTGGSIAPVPEPATWTMMILGMGLVGASRRRSPRSAA